MAFANLRTTMDMAEWDAATVKINYALKSAIPAGRTAVLNMAKLSGPSEITVMRFTIRDNGGDYAIVTVDSTYLLSIHSSHGTWAYRWHDTGDRPTFIEHLLKMHSDYLTKKLNAGRDEVFDVNRSAASLRKFIIRMRRQKEFATADIARSLYDDACGIHDKESFDALMEELGLDTFEGHEQHCYMKYENGICNFIETQWPLVRQCLQTVVAEFGK